MHAFIASYCHDHGLLTSHDHANLTPPMCQGENPGSLPKFEYKIC